MKHTHPAQATSILVALPQTFKKKRFKFMILKWFKCLILNFTQEYL